MCIAVQGGKAEKKAKLVYEPCTTKTPGQVFEYDEKNSQIRYDGMCVDFLGGGSATAGNNFGLYKCKKQCGNQPVRQAGLEVLFIILAASMQHESAWRPRSFTRTFDFRTGRDLINTPAGDLGPAELEAVARDLAEAVGACVEIKILRRVRAESSRCPPRHRRDACSMAWRCRFLAARPSQDGRVIGEK